MGRDKAALALHGAAAAGAGRVELLAAVTATQAFISVRAGPAATIRCARDCPQIVDQPDGVGPDRRHRRGAGARIPRPPGWCSPATCRSSTTHRSRTWSRHRDAARAGHRLSPAATTACPNRCARSTSRPRAPACWPAIAAGRNCPRKFLIHVRASRCSQQPDPRGARQREHAGRTAAAHATCSAQRPRRVKTVTACSTSRCCASRPGAARRRSTTAARHAGGTLRRSCARGTRFTLPRCDAARRGQRRVPRLVAAAAGERPRRVHSAGGRRLMRAFSLQHRRRSTRPAVARRSPTRPAAATPRSKAGCATTTKAARCTRLEYEAFAALGRTRGRAHRRRGHARASASSTRACVHRVGNLGIGDIAVWVGVSARASRRGVRAPAATSSTK